MTDAPVEIVLVEDNPHDVELALRILRKQNIATRVQVLRDGAEALDYMLCQGQYTGRVILELPRLVLLDLKLPKVDGLEVLRRLKLDPRTKAVPIVALTSSREERDISAAYQHGANSYIVKPVDFDQFAEVVRNLGSYWLLLNQGPLRAAMPENAVGA